MLHSKTQCGIFNSTSGTTNHRKEKNMVTKITEIRKQQGITQTELAERLKIDRTHLNKVENGKVRPSTRLLERIAAELGVSVKDFF